MGESNLLQLAGYNALTAVDFVLTRYQLTVGTDDIGHFRWMIGPANAQAAYLRELVGLVRRIAHMNRIVFTNDPMVLDRASDYAALRGAYSRIIMFLPSFNADVWRERILARGDDEKWVQNVYANYNNDLRTWAEVASGSAVPIFRVSFLSDVEV